MPKVTSRLNYLKVRPKVTSHYLNVRPKVISHFNDFNVRPKVTSHYLNVRPKVTAKKLQTYIPKVQISC